MDFSGLETHKNEERKGFLDRKHRKKMILPHLSYSYKKEAETQDKSLPKHKFDDLMIGINKLTQTYIRTKRENKYFRETEAYLLINLPLQGLKSKEIQSKRLEQNHLLQSLSNFNLKIDIGKRSKDLG